MIKVLIVDDSRIIHEQLTYVLEQDPDIKIIGRAMNGKEAILQVANRKPDIILMDIHMPDIDGFETTTEIMSNNPVPIIIITSIRDEDDAYLSFKAMKAGALIVVKKPLGYRHKGHDKEVKDLIKYVKLMSEITVVTKWKEKTVENRVPTKINRNSHDLRKIDVIVIGSSTGGPTVLEEILSKVPGNLSVPIVVVQHMAAGFIDSFVKWLNLKTDLTVKLAENFESMKAGHVYFAPDGHHIRVGKFGKIVLSQESPVNELRPTVAKLFNSVCEIYRDNAFGIILTGMGNDGVKALKLMYDAGAITVAQDEASCIVYGMPKEAVKLKAVEYILNPAQIATTIKYYCN